MSTYATMQIDPAAFEDIKAQLKRAGYSHYLTDYEIGGVPTIVMDELAVQPSTNYQQAACNPVMAERGEVLGQPYPDWPDWCVTFRERLAYQQGVADARLHALKTNTKEPT